ncbi:MAG: gas vesicle protein K [Chlorobium sp.]
MDDDKLLLFSGSPENIIEELGKIQSIDTTKINANPQNVESGLAKLVLTLIDLIRRLMEKQAMRRIEGGSLTDAEIENLGETLMKLEMKMEELKKIFNLTDKDLNINLGPLGDLL